MEQPTSSTPPSPAVAPQETTTPQKTPVWVWILGGCLGIIVLTMIAMGGFAWWAAKKVKQEFKENQPKLEEWSKDAQKMQQQAEEWQKEMEKIQNQMPEIPASPEAPLE